MEKFIEQFRKASEDVKVLEDLSDDEKLELYGLYKQALFGNCNIEKPNRIYFKEYSKYNAWNENKGMEREKAMQLYIKKVKILLNS
jgi:diazepam-binding inhibitor (GABA receptor modulating acyl-CoA-binding protein)